MRHPLRLVTVLAALFIVACSNVAPAPAPAPEVALLSTPYLWEPGGAFLPPIGSDVDTTRFYAIATVTITVHRHGDDHDATPVESFSATAEDGFYMHVWSVRNTLRATDKIGLNFVTVRVWAADPPAAGPTAEACVDPAAIISGDGCLVGSFDAALRIPKAGKSRLPDGMLDLTRTQSLPIKFFIPSVAAEAPTSITEIHRWEEPRDRFEDAGPNCMANEFTLPGQGLNALGSGLNAIGSGLNALGSGLNALGSVGGMIVIETGTSMEPHSSITSPIRLIEPEDVGSWLWPIQGMFELDRNTAILIADDFASDHTGHVYSVGVDVVARLVAASASQEALELEFQALKDDRKISHGALVMHNTLETLKGAGFVVDEALNPASLGFSGWDGFHVLRRPGAEHYLVVAAVDTGGFNTDEVTASIRRALSAIDGLNYLPSGTWGVDYRNNGLDVQQVVVNMSFVIVPCEVLLDFRASNFPLFEDYVRALGADNGIAEGFYGDLLELLVAPTAADTDPLLGLVDFCVEAFYDDSGGPIDSDGFMVTEQTWSWDGRLSEDSEGFTSWYCNVMGSGVVYVASSGNFGMDYPLYPAYWPRVVASGSRDAVEPFGFADDRSFFSNAAEVTAPGSLLLLGEEGDFAVAYAGTSFSAPAVSAFTALDLGRSEPRCEDPEYSEWEPDVIAYIAGSLLAHGTFDDSWLPEALSHCD